MPKAIGQDAVIARMKAAIGAVTKAAAGQLEAEAKDLASAIRSAARERTGALKESVKAVQIGPDQWEVRAGGPLTTVKVRAGVKDPDFEKARVTGGHKGEYDYSRGVEFGHRTEDGEHVPAEPFFFNTYRARRAGIRSRIMKRGQQAAADADLS